MGIGTTATANAELFIRTAGEDASIQVQATGGSSLDAWINFAEDTNQWAVGIDDSDGDKFKINTVGYFSKIVENLIISKNSKVAYNFKLKVDKDFDLGKTLGLPSLN